MFRQRLLAPVVFVVLTIVFGFILVVPSRAQNQVGVNITDNFSAIDQAVSLVNSDGQSNGGWVVMMPKIGNCTDVSNILSGNQGSVNFVLRLHYPDTVPNDDYALSWASTLVKIAESTDDVIYVYPWNEPNMPRECGGNANCEELVRNHVAKLREYLEQYGLWQTKVRVLSPMVNQSGPNFQSFVNALGSDFFSQFEGEVMNLYDFERETGGQACANTNPVLNACTFEPVLSSIPGGQSPAYAVEMGIVDESGSCPPQVTDCPFFEDSRMLNLLREAYDNHWFNNSNLAMAAPLFYNPEIASHPVWLWGSQSENYMRSVARRRSGSTSQYTYDATSANQTISELIANGSLVQCENSCGVATSQSLCQAAYGNTSNDLAGYDTSLYDAYNADQDQFYIHPILGLNRAQDGSAGAYDVNLKTIRTDLINQGYEARCATPGFRIELTQSGKDWMADYVEQFPPGAVFGGAENYYIRNRISGPPGIGNYVRSWLAVDYRDVQVPVFRNVTDKRYIMTSLDEYFGFKDTAIQENTASELNSAAINSLLTNQQRCEASVRILLAQETMCNKLANPDACALYSRPVPETDYTIKTLLAEYKGLAAAPHPDLQPNPLPAYNDPVTIKAVCNEVVGTDWNERARTGFLYTPLTIDRAYRLAFLVTQIELKHPTYASMFNFYIHPNEGPVGGPSKPDDAILINAFKVPDILTTTQVETTGGGNLGNTAWSDSSKLTRNSLITRKKQVDYQEKAQEKIADLQTAASWYDVHSQTSSDQIFCLVGASNRGIGPPECIDELGKAVIDIVNAQTSQPVADENKIDGECPDLIKEPADSILDFGSFGPVSSITNPPNQLLYTEEFGAELLHNVFEVPAAGQDPTEDLDATHQIEPKGESHPSFAETWKPGDPDDGANPLGTPRDWGLKSLFHVTDRTYPNFPYNGCCDERDVRHFLVYPVGYDMSTVQEVLAGTFFTSAQIETLTEQAEEFDRIQVGGDHINFTGGTRDHTFSDDRIEPPNWNGQPGPIYYGQQGGVYDIDSCDTYYEYRPEGCDPGVDPSCHRVPVGWELPCERTFGWEIEQKGAGLSAGILGGRFGFWLREIQKTLNTSVGTARSYLNSCESVENFLLGQCGKGFVPVPVNDDADPNCTALSCTPPQPTQPPQPTIAITPGPINIGGCNDPTKDDFSLRIFVNEVRQWKIGISCPSCTGDWGDVGLNATVQPSDQLTYFWGRFNLHPQDEVQFPNLPSDPGYGETVPNNYQGQLCADVKVTGNSSGNQCPGELWYHVCTTVQ